MASKSSWRLVLEEYVCQRVRDEFCALGDDAQAQMLSALQASADDEFKKGLREAIESTCAGITDEQEAKMRFMQQMQCEDATVPKAYRTLAEAFRSAGAQVDNCPPFKSVCAKLAEERLPSWGLPQPKSSLLAGLHVHHIKRKAEQAKLQQDPTQMQMKDTNSSVRKQSADSSNTTWRTMRPTLIGDLHLFEPLAGTRLDGVLVAMPTLTVGVLTALEDSTGQVMMLGLYNLPGATTQEFVEKLLPLDKRITLVEPFLKIMVDGSRGIRVDDPSDVVFHGDERHRQPFEEAKREGNEAFGAGNFEAAAIKWEEALANDKVNTVHLLLSNRAQAQLAKGGSQHAEEALRDAAAALILRPSNQKARVRIVMALRRLASRSVVASAERCMQQPACTSDAEEPPTDVEEDSALAADQLMVAALEATPPSTMDKAPPCAGRVAQNGQQRDPDEQRELGNTAYKAGLLDEAIEAYTAGFASPLATLVAQVLSNLSATSLKMQRPQSALAFAAAALRVAADSGHREKPTFRLGQALVQLRCFRAASVVLKWSVAPECKTLADDLDQCARRAQGGCSTEEALAGSGTASCVEFCGPVQAVLIEGKGRGLRATRAIAFGECLLINRSLVSAVVD